MNDRFFLDTNIFLYSFDRNLAKKAQRATQLIRQALTTRKGIISYQVAQEFLNVALRRFETPLSVSEAEQYLATVLSPLLVVHSSLSLYQAALQIREKILVSWYDALILEAALDAGCAVLYSEDFQHGQRIGAMRIVNPFLQ